MKTKIDKQTITVHSSSYGSFTMQQIQSTPPINMNELARMARGKNTDPDHLEPGQKQVDLIARTFMIDDGLVPTYLLSGTSYDKVVQHIEAMSPSKQRAQKRKFRKVYRLAQKEYPINDSFFSTDTSPGQRRQRHVTYWYRMRARQWLKGKKKKALNLLDVEDLLINTRDLR